MDGILRLYPHYKGNSGKQKSDPAKTPCHFTSLQNKVDKKLQTDINEVRDTFKDFLDPINEIKNEVDKLDVQSKKDREARHAVFSALSPISPLRRISSLPDNIEDENYARAAGLVGLAAVNLPEDTRDLVSAYNQVFKGKLPNYDYKNYQHEFSFFRGTVLEPIVNKMGKAGAWLHSIDNSLYNTKFGGFIADKLKIDISDIDTTGRKVPTAIMDEFGKITIEEVLVKSYKLEGKGVSKLIGRGLLRIPVLSIIALGLLEVPSIVKSLNKEDKPKENVVNVLHQTLKSGINITSILSGIGIVGGLLAKKGPAGSLLGMGLGSVAGAYVSHKIGDGLDMAKEKCNS